MQQRPLALVHPTANPANCKVDWTLKYVSTLYTIHSRKQLLHYFQTMDTINQPTFEVLDRDIEVFQVGDEFDFIPERAFEGCTKLREVILGEKVRSVGDRAFIYCPNLATLTIPAELEQFGFFCFFGCIELQRLAKSNEQREIISYLKHGKKFHQLSQEDQPSSLPDPSRSRVESARSRSRRRSTVLDTFNANSKTLEVIQNAPDPHEDASQR